MSIVWICRLYIDNCGSPNDHRSATLICRWSSVWSQLSRHSWSLSGKLRIADCWLANRLIVGGLCLLGRLKVEIRRVNWITLTVAIPVLVAPIFTYVFGGRIMKFSQHALFFFYNNWGEDRQCPIPFINEIKLVKTLKFSGQAKLGCRTHKCWPNIDQC